MGGSETDIGGNKEGFPETVWSSILSSADADSPARREKLNRLCSKYWKPVYAFVRASWGKTVEDAKDLTQGFFCHVIEGDLVSRYRPDVGRFRCFLKGALRNFLAEAHRDSRALKRGGGKTIVSLDVENLETAEFLADARARSPEELFDLEWAREVTARSLERLREILLAEGKRDHLRVYEAYELSPAADPRPTYEELARSLGLSVSDVRNHLFQARSRLRELALKTISEYVTSPDELQEEMKDLFSA